VPSVKAGLRNYELQAELKDDYVLALEETRLRFPSNVVIENELLGKVESAVKTLPPICEVLTEGRESPYNSTYPLLKGNSGCNIANSTKGMRKVIKQVLESY
jgi:hypothetical protein